MYLIIGAFEGTRHNAHIAHVLQMRRHLLCPEILAVAVQAQHNALGALAR